jgi:2-iminobutanoate/2-iminopropanoate deaminase
MAEKRVIFTEKGMVARRPCSQGWGVGDLAIVAAHRSYEKATGEVIGDTFEQQFDNVVSLARPVLEATGCRLEDVIRAGVFLRDMSYYEEYNRCFALYFPASAPARCTVGAGSLPDKALIQMEFVAVIPGGKWSSLAPCFAPGG